jgi:hypothetical protein
MQFDRAKSLQELEGHDWGDPSYDSHLVTECHRLHRIPLCDFTVEDLRITIGQNITATVLRNDSVQLNLLYESKGEVIDGVKTQSHSERQLVFRPSMVPARWRLALPPIGPHLVVAMRPIIIP